MQVDDYILPRHLRTHKSDFINTLQEVIADRLTKLVRLTQDIASRIPGEEKFIINPYTNEPYKNFPTTQGFKIFTQPKPKYTDPENEFRLKVQKQTLISCVKEFRETLKVYKTCQILRALIVRKNMLKYLYEITSWETQLAVTVTLWPSIFDENIIKIKRIEERFENEIFDNSRSIKDCLETKADQVVQILREEITGNES